MALDVVAKTILEQLGGNMFVRLTGAREIVDLGNGISIMFPKKFSPTGVNKMNIILTPMDEYDITFGKVDKGNYTEIEKYEGVYSDMLVPLFEDTTGLLAHL